jgi:uncharacterized membrane protein YphA (DoxX/SURF4 family)
MIKYLFFVLRIVLGIIFLYSGYSKLFNTLPLEMSLTDTGLFNWGIAPFVSRFFVGLEFLLGFMLILGFRLKKITTPLAIGLLSVFSLYLLFLLITQNSNVDCNCFGDKILMTASQALVKNIVMILMLGCFLKFSTAFELDFDKNSNFYYLFISAMIIYSPFISNKMDANFANFDKNKTNYTPPLHLLNPSNDTAISKINYKSGKQILAFLSISCKHCNYTAKKLGIMKRQNPNLPISLIINGDKKELNTFIEKNNARNLSFQFFKGKETLIQIAGPNAPVIMLLNNGVVEFKPSYKELSDKNLTDWFNKEN